MSLLNNRTIRAAGLLILLGVVAASALYLANRLTPYSEARSIGEGAASFQDLSGRFETLAHARGGAYAYEVLRRAPLPSGTDFHLLGHVIGDILYEQEGAAGIARCTQDFRNACSHSIVIGTLNEYGTGTSTLARIDAYCKEAPGGSGAYTMCYHGLGHGVFAYFGYDIVQTVTLCEKIAEENGVLATGTECIGGMIMELVGGGGHDHERWVTAREKYLTDDPLSPCLSSLIPENAKPLCLTYLTPRLWERVGMDINRPDPTRFAQAFLLCDALTDPVLAEACYGGFGKEFLPLAGGLDTRDITRFTDDSFRLTASWCADAPSAIGREACIRSAVDSAFWGGENDATGAIRFCGIVEGSLRDACFDRLALAVSLFITDVGERERLCKTLPQTVYASCNRPAVVPLP